VSRRSFAVFALVALAGAFVITRWIGAPSYTDVYYHLNAANRLASGQGLTDAYVWTYIGALDHLPMPSHLYWMPLTSVLAGVSMALFNAPGDYAVAQFPFVLMFAATACVGFWLGWRFGGTRRHAWVAGLLTLLSGFYAKFWGAIDTFAPYALVGALCLVYISIGAGFKARSGRQALVWFLTGALAGLGHLTRADGVLLLIVGVMVIGGHWIRRAVPLRTALLSLVLLLAGYGVVMLPYFVRNLSEIRTPLPLGGTQTIWFDEYNDIFNYPPDASPATLFADGLGAFIDGRREALVNNIGTVVAVEGMVILTPLMLIGLWRRRRDKFLYPFALYALGLHLAMTFVFPFPGYRGGLLHSAAALIPFWAALGVAGLDDAVNWVAKRRRRWNARTAKQVFSGGLVVLALGLTLYIGLTGRVHPQSPTLYGELLDFLPADARILSDDPPELYYYTGMGGATLPNAAPETLLKIAQRYEIDYLLLKNDMAGIPAPLLPIVDNPPDFLTLLPFDSARLYAIQR
jgi:hypothetical protein